MGVLVTRTSISPFMELSEAPGLATYRSRMLEGTYRLGVFMFFGGDSGTNNSYARLDSTDYVEGECIYVGNKGYVAKNDGTTASSAPTFDNTTKRSKSSNTGGSETVDGTVTWVYYTDVTEDWAGSGWSEPVSTNGSHRASAISAGGNQLGYYDFQAVCWQIHDYLSDRGLASQSVLNRLQFYAMQAMEGYHFIRHGGDYTGVGGNTESGFNLFTEGFYQDFAHQSGRYKYAAVATQADLKEYAETSLYGAISDSTYPWGAGSMGDNGNVFFEKLSRETAYAANAYVQAIRAGATFSDKTANGATMQPMAFMIPMMLQHMNRWMNDAVVDDGFAPFMFGVTAQSLIAWCRVEEANGRDPDRFTSHASIGTTPRWVFDWRTNTTHGICRAWPTIRTAIEDFCEWLRNTSVSSVGTGSVPMWEDDYDGSGYTVPYYRTTDIMAGAGDPSGYTADTNNLIAPIYAWLSRKLFEEGGGVTGRTAAQFMQDADDLTYGWIGRPYYAPTLSGAPYFTGKPFNQSMKYYTDYLRDRNAVSGRSD